MKGFAWNSLTERAAKRAKFEEAHYPLLGQSFGLLGEVSPNVQVSFRRVTWTEVQAEAYLGIYVEGFEQEWRERRLRAIQSPSSENPLFILYAVNVKSIREAPWSPNAPSDQDVALVEHWLDRVFEYANGLPRSIPSLVAAIEANNIGDLDVESYGLRPFKLRGFVNWLRRVHGVDLGECLAPRLADWMAPDEEEPFLRND